MRGSKLLQNAVDSPPRVGKGRALPWTRNDVCFSPCKLGKGGAPCCMQDDSLLTRCPGCSEGAVNESYVPSSGGEALEHTLHSGSLHGFSPWGRKELDRTEMTERSIFFIFNLIYLF